MLFVVIALVVVVLGIGGYFARNMFAPKATTYIEINVTPWGKVKSITTTDGKRSVDIPAGNETPLRIAVPPGDYKVTIAGPDGTENSELVKATDEAPGACCNMVFQQIDVDKVVNAQ